MVDTWAFSFFSTKGATREIDDIPFEDYQATFRDHLDLVVKSESFGIDGWAWVEHHFDPMSNCPTPHLLVANAAARTKKLKFGVLGSVLPLNQAWRFAEEVATLDLLTEGRFEPGIVPGAGPVEVMKAGINPAEQRPRYYSAAEYFLRAAANGRVTMQDDFVNVTNLPVIPPVRPELARQVWVAAMSPDSAAWTAHKGFRLSMGWFPTETVVKLAGMYRAATEEAGRVFDPSMLGLRRRVFVADSDAEAQEKYEQVLDLSRWTVREMLEMGDPKIKAMLTDPDDYIIGSPDTVAEKLIAQCEAGGIGRVFAFYDFGDWSPEVLTRSLELLGKKVAPRLKSANISAPATASGKGTWADMIGVGQH